MSEGLRGWMQTPSGVLLSHPSWLLIGIIGYKFGTMAASIALSIWMALVFYSYSDFKKRIQ